MRNPVQETFFAWTSLLTRYFPRFGAKALDIPVKAIVGSRLLGFFLNKVNERQVKKVRTFRRFLVNPDVHIGDAIMAQFAVSALRDFFPDAQIDFTANRGVTTLIEGNPEISNFIPAYSGGVFAPDAELATVGQLMQKGDYDLLINMNPFIDAGKLTKGRVFDFMSHSPSMIRNESTPNVINHILYQYHCFVHRVLDNVAVPKRATQKLGVTVGLSDAAVEEAEKFVEGFAPGRRLVLMNTDTASPYTRLPFQYQVDLTARLLRDGAAVLMGAGHNEPGLGERLLATVPVEFKGFAKVIPAQMSLDAFSALGDLCDLFVSGDTGPMHIAAARKYSRTGKYTVRNRTALLCFFGATTSRMSGYDSHQPGYLPANQDAPSWTFVAGSPCRNITCLNKLFKTCETVRCFEVLDLNEVMAVIAPYLSALPPRAPSLTGKQEGRQVEDRDGGGTELTHNR